MTVNYVILVGFIFFLAALFVVVATRDEPDYWNNPVLWRIWWIGQYISRYFN